MQTQEKIMRALDAFVRQRPGLEFGNYGNVSAYRSEMRSITRDLHDYRTLAAHVTRSMAWDESLSADAMLEAFRDAFSGRLSCTVTPEGSVRLDYCTGQYFPTEYRKAACAVLASLLWSRQRDSLPAETPNKGDAIRASFVRTFGRRMARRWFDA